MIFFGFISALSIDLNVYGSFDYSVDVDYGDNLSINVLKSDMSVYIHNKIGYDAIAYDSSGNELARISEESEHRLVDFGEFIGTIVVIVKNTMKINISTIDYNQFANSSSCHGKKIVISGPRSTYNIVSFDSDFLGERDLTYSKYQQFCIWLINFHLSDVEIKSKTDEGYDLLYVTDVREKSDNPEYRQSCNFSVSGSQVINIYGVNSLFLVWKSGRNGKGKYLSIASNVQDSNINLDLFKITYIHSKYPVVPANQSSIGYYSCTDSLNDISVDLTEFSEFRIALDTPGYSVIIHNSYSYEAMVYDQNMNNFANFTYKSYFRIVDFADSSGLIVVKWQSASIGVLKFSYINYGFAPVGNGCSNLRVVSGGSFHKYHIASAFSQYYKYRNLTYSENNDVCIWFSSPFSQSHHFIGDMDIEDRCNIGYNNYDFNTIDSTSQWFSGKFNFLAVTHSSLLIHMKSNRNPNFNDRHLLMESSSSALYEYDLTSYVIWYEPSSSPHIVSFNTSSTSINISGMIDATINMNGFDKLFIYCDYASTSVVIHNKVDFNATIVIPSTGFSETIISGQDSVFDFGNNIGYIVLQRTGDGLKYVQLSAIVYDHLENSESCSSVRYVKTTIKENFVIASPSSRYYHEKTLSYESNQSICLWFASPVMKKHTIKIDSENGMDSIYMFSPLLQVTNDMIHYIKFSGYNISTFEVANSVLYFWKTDSNNTYRHVKIMVDSTSGVSSSDFNQQDIIYTYTSSPSIPINNNSIMINNVENDSHLHYEIRSMNDTILDVSNYNSIEIECLMPGTCVLFPDLSGFSIIAYDSKHCQIGALDSQSKYPVIDYGNEIGKIIVTKLSMSKTRLLFSHNVFSLMPIGVDCIGKKIVGFGENIALLLSSQDSPGNNYTIKPADAYCIWLSGFNTMVASVTKTVSTTTLFKMYLPPKVDSDSFSLIETALESLGSEIYTSIMFYLKVGSGPNSIKIESYSMINMNPVYSGHIPYDFSNSPYINGSYILPEDESYLYREFIQKIKTEYIWCFFLIIFGPFYINLFIQMRKIQNKSNISGENSPEQNDNDFSLSDQI